MRFLARFGQCLLALAGTVLFWPTFSALLLLILELGAGFFSQGLLFVAATLLVFYGFFLSALMAMLALLPLALIRDTRMASRTLAIVAVPALLGPALSPGMDRISLTPGLALAPIALTGALLALQLRHRQDSTH